MAGRAESLILSRLPATYVPPRADRTDRLAYQARRVAAHDERTSEYGTAMEYISTPWYSGQGQEPIKPAQLTPRVR